MMRRSSLGRSLTRILCFFAFIALIAACRGGGRAAASGKPLVAVSILPQAWFVERIGAGRVDVLTLVGPGQSPHSYDPSPRQMESLSRAAVWLRIGVEFEDALAPRIESLAPTMLVTDCTTGMVFRSLEEDHDHAEEGAQAVQEAAAGQAGADRDPHVWLGRSQATAMVLNIAGTLATLDPASSLAYHEAAAALIREIEASFAALAERLAPLRGSTVFVFHPSFGYFLDEFGIHQEAVETGGKEPSQRQLTALVERAREAGARVVFVQKQFSDRAARTVAQAIGGSVASMDPLAEDWFGNLEFMGQAIASALPEASPEKP